jgi:hypothetical protein
MSKTVLSYTYNVQTGFEAYPMGTGVLSWVKEFGA